MALSFWSWSSFGMLSYLERLLFLEIWNFLDYASVCIDSDYLRQPYAVCLGLFVLLEEKILQKIYKILDF